MHVWLHATCIELDCTGVVLLGPSGSGKSDLALRLIDAGAILVADDQVLIERVGAGLCARPAEALAGLLEVRGVGIQKLPHSPASSLRLVAQLEPDGILPRLPERTSYSLLGVELPQLRLDPRLPSACAQVRIALRAERVA
ncbi:MAG: HPr kinase/phosphorylase [Geminicoccaceae bacterium]